MVTGGDVGRCIEGQATGDTMQIHPPKMTAAMIPDTIGDTTQEMAMGPKPMSDEQMPAM